MNDVILAHLTDVEAIFYSGLYNPTTAEINAVKNALFILLRESFKCDGTLPRKD